MDSQQLLEKIKVDLDTLGIDSVVHRDESTDTSRLLVYIGGKADTRKPLLELSAQVAEIGAGQPSTGTCVRLQFDAMFPFGVEDVSLSDVAQFLHLLNLQIEIPGFYLNHFDNRILYRYVLLVDAEHIPQQILLSVIGMVMLLQDTFGKTLERLATGKVSFIDLLQEIQHTLTKVKL